MSPRPYPSPLAGYENASPLPTGLTQDGKSLDNYIPGQEYKRSKAYDEFVDPIDNKGNGFDFHGASQIIVSTKYRIDLCYSILHAHCPDAFRIRQESPREDSTRIPGSEILPLVHFQTRSDSLLQLRVYPMKERPVGPHPTGMFEVNTFNPHETGTLMAWLVIHRGPLS